MTHMPRLERKNAPEAGLAEIKAAIDGLATTTKQAVTELTERMDELEKKAARPRLGNGDDPKAITPEQARQERKALGTYARTGDETELKAMSVGVDPDGGYTVAPVLSNAMTTKLWDQSPVRRLARMETITVGDAFEEPIDNSESGASWVGEAESRAATTTPTLGYIRVPVQEIYASQKITQRLLDDSRYDLGSWLEGKISDKFGRSEGTAYVSGDGVKRPRGFLTYDTDSAGDATRAWGKLQYVVSGDASGFVTPSSTVSPADALKNLYWALRAPYRANATWLMSSATAGTVDKFKDGQGNYIWRDGVTAGAPPSLLGRPVEICEDMPAVGAGNFPIAFGDFKKGYLIVEKAGIKMLRDPFTDKPHVIFYAYRRVGGGLANSEAIKLLKIST
jgi:HK97 family phage major capsid protein